MEPGNNRQKVKGKKKVARRKGKTGALTTVLAIVKNRCVGIVIKKELEMGLSRRGGH